MFGILDILTPTQVEARAKPGFQRKPGFALPLLDRRRPQQVHRDVIARIEPNRAPIAYRSRRRPPGSPDFVSVLISGLQGRGHVLARPSGLVPAGALDAYGGIWAHLHR